jgi:plastocyanin
MEKINLKNLSIIILFLLVIPLTQITFAEKEDRTRLETELVNSSTGQDDGNARFEERSDRKLLKVEIEDQKPNITFTIKIDGTEVGSITTDHFGFAEIELDNRKGSNIPLVKNSSKIEITSSNSVILSGIFGGQTVGTAITSSTPVATTSVTIPLGAKDRNVSEFFSPSSIQVNPLDAVIWTNKDDTAHTVTGSTFDSGLLSSGQTFSRKFGENGTFDYVCQLHSWMTGQVIVGSGGPASSPSTGSISSPSQPPSLTSQNKISIPAGAADKKVAEFFVPKNLTVKVNESVTWSNADSAIHTITSGVGNKDETFDSGLVGGGKSFSFTFSKSGTFDYFCQVHPWMIAQIIVGSGGTIPTESQSSVVASSLPSSSPVQSIPSTNIHTTSKVSIPLGATDKQVTENFVPKTVNLTTLDSVLWTNDDSAAHTVTSGLADKGGDGMFDSNILSAGKSFSFKFEKPGIVDYFCMVHPWMTGQVIIKGGIVSAKGTLLSPLEQIKSGVALIDVQCRSNFSLVIKANDNSSACVRPETAKNLLERGWKTVV